MKKRILVSPERAIELEKWLLENSHVNITYDDLLEFSDFDKNEIEYLIGAYHMPVAIIMDELTTYDAADPCMDELLFVALLQEKYNCTSNMIINRITMVRAICKYLNQNPNVKVVFPRVSVYDKLVRDNIPDIIEASGKNAVCRVLNDQEYWEFLLRKDSEELEEVKQAKTREEIKEELGDKLEIIRAMALHWGYSLEDIVEEASKKRSKDGAFTKRVLLKRTYKLSEEES